MRDLYQESSSTMLNLELAKPQDAGTMREDARRADYLIACMSHLYHRAEY